jgi:hypothetical protein
MDSLPYRFIGETTDALLLFENRDYPSDAPRTCVPDEVLRQCASTDPLIDGARFFAVSARHADVRGFLFLALSRNRRA